MTARVKMAMRRKRRKRRRSGLSQDAQLGTFALLTLAIVSGDALAVLLMTCHLQRRMAVRPPSECSGRFTCSGTGFP